MIDSILQRSVKNMGRNKAFNQEKVLKKAMQLFWEKGYEATSIQDLEEQVGIGRRSLYNTFGNKRDLYLAALDYYSSQDEHAIFTDSARSIRAIDEIKEIFRDLAASAIEDEQRCGCFMVNSAIELAPHDEEITQRSSTAYTALQGGFSTLIDAAKAQGDISLSKDTHALAHYLANASLGYRVMAKMNPDQQAFRQITDVLLDSLR